jgi:CotH kinase protein/Lamin Tail Domain/Fn3 associated/Secretion system C-terminal sorting domain
MALRAKILISNEINILRIGMKKRLFISLFIMTIGLYGFVLGQDSTPKIFINEFMASNLNTILSADVGEYSDWIEIHNADNVDLTIAAYYLTDDLTDPQKWQIPSGTTISAGQKVIFWADGQNEGRHTNFKLAADGEEIGLFTPDGKLIDSIRFTQQTSDVSCGRFPDAGDTLCYFEQPTPGTSNINPGYAGIVPDPVFSIEGGLHQDGLSIGISKSNLLETIRYTLDGSIPDLQSPIYTNEIILNSTTVVRIRSFRENHIPSRVLTQTYFINEITALPLVSVATNPENLWDDEIGIYVEGTNGVSGYCVSEPRNWNQPWERRINLEMFEENGEQAFNIQAGMQIGGGCTRKYPQKTLAIYTRSEYGNSIIDYPIFDDKNIDTYNNINLRNSGQDWWRGMFRDGLMHTIVKDHMDIDWQAYKPAVLFLNGEYWGIHGIREKHNEHYLASNHGIDPDAIDILSGGGSVKQGSAENYDNMIEYIETHDLRLDEHYHWVETQMDIGQYQNYIIAEIYFANIDWPGGNIKFWRQQGEGHKWRWILYDTDLGFGAHSYGQYDSNSLENATSPVKTYYANPEWSTFLLRNLLENEGFKEQFIQRFASHLNITFEPSRVLGLIDSLKNNLEMDMPRHIQKWPQSTSFNDGWTYHINKMKEFASLRPGYVLDHLSGKFNVNDTTRLHVHNSDISMGNIYIGGVKLPQEDYEGVYFTDVALECKAVPKPGYIFIGWQGDVESTDEIIKIVLNSESNLNAIFRFDRSIVYHGLRINEILASNDHNKTDENGNFDDWIELYNHSLEAVNIGGMYVTDNFQEPKMWQIPDTDPELTTIQPGEFLLLWADKEMEEGILHLDLKLSSIGEELGLGKDTDSGFVMIDTFSFAAQTTDVSYGRSPDGSNERSFFMTPTPGTSNVSVSSNHDLELPQEYALAQNYPNPFNPVTSIHYELPTDSRVDLVVYDISGRKIADVISEYQAAGFHTISWNAVKFPSGIYFYRLTAGDHVETRKMILMK